MKLNKENLRALAAEVVAAKKAETAKAKKPAKPEAPAKGKPEAPKTEPATAKAPKPAADKPAAAPAKTEAKPAPAKPAKAEAPKAKPAAPVKAPAEVAADWERLVTEQAAEVVALVKGAGKCARPVRLVTGVAVPPAALAEYRAMIARHGKARAAMRDNPATTEGVYLAALRALGGDEVAALCELGMMHSAGAAGVVAVPALRARKDAEVWARALQAAKPGAVSVVVSVRAIAAAPKPAAKPEKAPAPKPEAKPEAKPAPAKVEKPAAAPAAPKGTGKPRKL